MRQEVVDYWSNTNSPTSIGKPNVIISRNKRLHTIQTLKRKIPLQVYKRLSPLMGKQH